MVPTERLVLEFLVLILCIINGLHSYPTHQPSLGILNQLIDQDSKSPLIVVVDSNNQATTLNNEQDLRQGQRKNHHVHNPDHHSNNDVEREYENALYELLRTSERMLEEQYARSRGKKNRNGKKMGKEKKSKNGKYGKKEDSCEVTKEKKPKNGKKKVDSCEDAPTQFLAEQCSNSENSCEFSDTC